MHQGNILHLSYTAAVDFEQRRGNHHPDSCKLLVIHWHHQYIMSWQFSSHDSISSPASTRLSDEINSALIPEPVSCTCALHLHLCSIPGPVLHTLTCTPYLVLYSVSVPVSGLCTCTCTCNLYMHHVYL